MRTIEQVIGNENAQELRNEFEDILDSGNVGYDDVEELMYSYGLEMDYIFDLIGF